MRINNDYQTLTKRATPTQPVHLPDKGHDEHMTYHLCCRSCSSPIINVWNSKEYKPKYCHYCGQAIDWSKGK